jgi:hypothetical protein
VLPDFGLAEQVVDNPHLYCDDILAFGSLVFANEFLAVVKDSKIENLMRSLQSEKNDKKN